MWTELCHQWSLHLGLVSGLNEELAILAPVHVHFLGRGYAILETFPRSLHEVDGIVLQIREYGIEGEVFQDSTHLHNTTG
jgi:hypothetical protein